MKLISRSLIWRSRRLLMADALLMGICLLSVMMLVLSASAEQTSLQDLLLYTDESNEMRMTPVHALQRESDAQPTNAVLEEEPDSPVVQDTRRDDKEMTPVTEIEKPLAPAKPAPKQATGKKPEKAPAAEKPVEKQKHKALPEPAKTATKDFPPLNPPPEGLPEGRPDKDPALMPDPVAEEIAPPADIQKPQKAESPTAPPSDLELPPPAVTEKAPEAPGEELLPELSPLMPDQAETVENPAQEDKKAEKPEKPEKPEIVYKPLPAMAVFPVLRHGDDKAFGDVAILFATEFAQQLESKYPETRIHNPVYSAEQLRLRGLGRIYDQMIDYYIKAGRPEPRALNFLLSELADDGLAIERAIFVEADVDLHHQTRSFRPKDLLMKFHSGALPDEQRYYVMTRIQIYDTSSPHQPKIWSYSWNQPVKTTGLYNVTASVFQDSDSITLFSRASRMMNRGLLLAAPKRVYMEGVTDIGTDIQGEVVDQTGAGTNTPPKPGSGRLSDADRRTLERLLRQQ